jgi:hypothetical protein
VYWARCSPSARTATLLTCVAFLTLLASGCATPSRLPVRAERYTIDVHLDLATHQLTGQTAIDLIATHPAITSGPVSIELELHPDLRITNLRASGAELASSVATPVAAGAPSPVPQADAPAAPMCRHAITLRRPVESLTLYIEYEGRLVQDVAAGEKPGEIHNFTMRAHIASDGLYLADGCWYPQPTPDPAEPMLAEFILTAHAPPGVELIASGERDESRSASAEGFAWHSPYPLQHMSLVGGPLTVHRDKHRDHDIAVYLSAEHSADANLWLSAIKTNLDRYEPRIGPLPARDYAVVENFFSSGFAFPCFTLLSSAVIAMGERSATTHGYLDHEMLHSWWGNGVLVDPRDGNWCEALTSYCTNYYGHVLDGNEAEARRKRRNYSHFLSRLKPQDDKPLGTFGLPNGCNRTIAYDKGAMVFHMLAMKMGQDRFWSAMRKLITDRTGDFASWETIRAICEKEHGKPLDGFFSQWVRGGGAPKITLESATLGGNDPTIRAVGASPRTQPPTTSDSDATIALTVRQSAPAFEIDELRLRARTYHSAPDSLANTSGGFSVPLTSESHSATINIPFNPDEIILDPDYHTLRKVAPEELVPTTAATRRGAAFAVVTAPGELPDEYAKLKKSFESSWEPGKRIQRTTGQIEEAALAERSTLILGDAVRDPYIEAFLTAIEFPVTWSEDEFEFDDEVYDDPDDAVLCTIRHPGVVGGGVTVVFANSTPAIPKANFVPMYEHSLVIFHDGKPVLRQDFENPQTIKVQHATK